MKLLKLALRSLLHFRVYSVINILGLALGLSCVIIIARYVYGELTIDHFEKSDRIFVVTEQHSREGKSVHGIYKQTASYPNITGHPSVEVHSSFFTSLGKEETIEVDKMSFNASSLITDDNFFKIVDIPLLTGSINLSDLQSILVTQEFAQKVFGASNPIGRTIKFNNDKLLTVIGVLGETRTSLKFDVVIPYGLSEWNRMNSTIVLLRKGSDYRAINKQYDKFFDVPLWRDKNIKNQLLPLKDLYFSNDLISESFSSSGNKNHISILVIIGFALLIISSVNFMNIYTVGILMRKREFGMKKVFGASGFKIFTQLFAENTFLILIALFLAFIFTELFSPITQNIIGLPRLSYTVFDFQLFGALLFVIPFITSVYPYIKFHYSLPIKSLGGKKEKTIIHYFFLALQSAISIILIVVSLFFLKQLCFLLHSDLGIRTKNIVQVPFIKEGTLEKNMDSWSEYVNSVNKIKEEVIRKLNEYPYIENKIFGFSPITSYTYPVKFRTNGIEKELIIFGINSNWQDFFKIKLLSGRLWDPRVDIPYRDYHLIITKSVLNEFNISDYKEVSLQPEKRLWQSSAIPIDDRDKSPAYRIIGVIDDFWISNLSSASKPIAVYFSQENSGNNLLAAIVPEHKKEAIEFLRKLHEETVGGEFEYSFIEDDIKALYAEDKKVAVIYSAFTLVAILISALGLFGMSLYDIQHRYKEIAIRKVNGANVKDILRLLLMKYLRLLVLAFVIATPLSCFAVYKYSENFARKTNLSWWIFALAFVVTAGISLLTLIYQTQKAANTNPSEVIKIG